MSESVPVQPSLEPMVYAPGSTTLWNNSWQHIYQHFSDAIMAYARRRGLSSHSAEDVLQEVMTTLIRCQYGHEAGYDSRQGAFQAWLWGVIRNRVMSVRRKDEKERPASPIGETETGVRVNKLPEPVQAPIDAAQVEENEWQSSLLAAALRKVQEKVRPENFEIYLALVQEKASVEELSRKYGKEANAIYAVKHRCEEKLLIEARALRESWELLRRAG